MITELANYQDRLDDLRGQIAGLIAGLSAEALNWRPLPGTGDHATNSLAALAAHTAGAEHFWISEVIGGRPATRDREAELATLAASAAEIVRLLTPAATYRVTWPVVERSEEQEEAAGFDWDGVHCP